MKRSLPTVLTKEDGSAIVEFVTVFWFFLILVFFVMEVTIALFWWKAGEKAALMGARAAIVSNAANTLVPAVNLIGANPSALNGDSCSKATTTCQVFGTVTCSGGTSANCNKAAFDKILAAINLIFAPAKANMVTVKYQYAGLGFAGGPSIPVVTVTLHGVPLQTGFVSIIGGLFGGTGNPLTTLPDMSATLTGEDLNSTGG